MKAVNSWCRIPSGYGLILLTILILASAGASGAADVRILIDVSGSMKQNDPNNLRVPAMRLVSELLPLGTRAGVWLFAEKTTPLIEPAEVDAAWRSQARKQLGNIHSRGLFTDIEDALEVATSGWDAETDPGERHIVLLTDGMVDVAGVPAESAASRARVLSSQLQRVRALGAQIHAVALSDNVDRELLDALTTTTKGLVEKAENAERLQRVFLHMLEQTAAPVTVPLLGRRFDLDDSVSEVTLLIFRNPEEAVTLYRPDGSTLTAASAESNVAWRSETGYDLITIAAPPAGSWRFDGAEDPDNRAVIVTDLALDMDPVPGTLLASEIVDLNAWMTNARKPVEQPDLVQLVAASVRIEGGDIGAATGAMPLNPDTLRFESRLDGRALTPGDYRLSVTLDSGTFKRELNRRVRFLPDPISVNYIHEAASPSSVIVEISGVPELLDVRSLSGYLAVTDEAGGVRAYPLPETATGIIEVEVPAASSGAHEFAPNVYFTTRYGRSLRLEPAPRVIGMAAVVPADAVTEQVEPPVEEIFSPAFAAAYVMLGNCVMALGFAAIWFMFRPRPRAPTSGGKDDKDQPVAGDAEVQPA